MCLSLWFSFSVPAALQGELWSLSSPRATTICQHPHSQAGFTKNLTLFGYNLSPLSESSALLCLLHLLLALLMTDA